MTINKLAQQIKDSVEKRVAALGEMQRDEIEADVKKTAYLQIRCYELWAKDGCNDAIEVAEYMNQAEEETIYPTRKGLFYRIDGTINKTEALGFLKDWSTSLVQLDTGAIAAIGLFVRYTDFAHSPIHGIADLRDGARYLAIVEVISIALSALSFFLSLVAGLFLLNALPGAAQRIPVDANAMRNDVFSIANISPRAPGIKGRWHPGQIYRRMMQSRTINTFSWWLRVLFLSGAFFFTLSIGCALLRAALGGPSYPLD
jgi:hypothetical protein